MRVRSQVRSRCSSPAGHWLAQGQRCVDNPLIVFSGTSHLSQVRLQPGQCADAGQPRLRHHSGQGGRDHHPQRRGGGPHMPAAGILETRGGWLPIACSFVAYFHILVVLLSGSLLQARGGWFITNLIRYWVCAAAVWWSAADLRDAHGVWATGGLGSWQLGAGLAFALW